MAPTSTSARRVEALGKGGQGAGVGGGGGLGGLRVWRWFRVGGGRLGRWGLEVGRLGRWGLEEVSESQEMSTPTQGQNGAKRYSMGLRVKTKRQT